MSEEEEQIASLVKRAKSWLSNRDETKKILDTLSAFGEKGVYPILDIADNSVDQDVREYGYELIKRVKERTR